MDNKKVLGISVAAVVILVIAIIATSYAAFTANLSGTKENKLNTGYVKLNCAETNFTLTDTQPLTDAQGISADLNNLAQCTLTSTMEGTMTVGYDIALTDVTPSTAITTSDVKIQASKVKGGTTTYLVGSSATSGVFVSGLTYNASDTSTEKYNGQYDKSITNYVLDSDTVTGNASIVYSVKAWVSKENNSSATNEKTTNTQGECSNSQYTTETTCKGAGEIWGTSQTETQKGSTFSFKLKVGATQVIDD